MAYEEDDKAEGADAGQEEVNSDSEGTVKISEEFQKEITPYIERATKPELEFCRSLIMERERELMKAETKSEKASDFDSAGMPAE